ncbi:MAG: MoaD/ThiS family protein [Candidatus Latescibacteria bacterium]|nr:MoaD/ThiS family protein [Candidatus Latescibacterota bacterium]
MTVYIPSPLRSYTGQRSVVEADGATLDAALRELDQCYPGFRFRIISEQDTIREHINIFVNRAPVQRLDVALQPGDTIHIICAISGG